MKSDFEYIIKELKELNTNLKAENKRLKNENTKLKNEISNLRTQLESETNKRTDLSFVKTASIKRKPTVSSKRSYSTGTGVLPTPEKSSVTASHRVDIISVNKNNRK